MRKRLILLSLFSSLFSAFGQNPEFCGTMIHDAHLQNQHPEIKEYRKRIERQTASYINSPQQNASRSIITIPTVVHVIYEKDSLNQNISNAQILSQIAILNEDFRRLNADTANTPSIFKGVAADTEIEFCLASLDPAGNPTQGITRTATDTLVWKFAIDDMKFTQFGGQDAWPATDYLNIWVCKLQEGVGGWAQFPGGPSSTDGIVVNYKMFGSIGTATPPYHKGRSTVHEVGHWLNVHHPWGMGQCGGDDFVEDTPLSDWPNTDCTFGHVSCGSTDMTQNYMDYADDACSNLFTLGQKLRMQALFVEGGPRESILHSPGCNADHSCFDHIQNGDETDIDCGGSVCPSCDEINNTIPEIAFDDSVKTLYKDWRVFPNPANDILHIQFLSLMPGKYTARLIDITGRVVLTSGEIFPPDMLIVELPVPFLTSGVYFLRLEGEGNYHATEKIVVIRN